MRNRTSVIADFAHLDQVVEDGLKILELAIMKRVDTFGALRTVLGYM
jgi:hypothetical protein